MNSIWLKRLPLDFADVCKYFPYFLDEDKAPAYGVAGGTPQYLLQMDDCLSIEKTWIIHLLSILITENLNARALYRQRHGRLTIEST